MAEARSPEVSGQDWASELARLWRRGDQPDVHRFLARCLPLTPGQLSELLCIDQHERWQAGQRILAEDYLQNQPALHADPGAAVDLIYQEYLIRERLGEQPSAAEYLRRFPAYAAELKVQIEFHQAVQPAVSEIDQEASRLAKRASLEPLCTVAVARQARALDRGVPSTEELPGLLRRRLRLVAIVSFAYCGFRAPILFPIFWSFAAVLFMLTMSGGLAVLLWSRRPLPLPALRGIELVLFGSLALCALGLNHGFFQDGWLAALTIHDWFGMVFATRTLTWIWVVQIIIYGILIPNTWQRCAAVVGALALAATTFNLASCVLESGVEPRLRTVFCVGFAIDVAVGGVVAVFGAHRLETLRGAAAEARKLGQYQLKQRLGAGGMGEVYLADHGLLRRPCALKLIRPERVGDPASLRRFEREVQVTATLTHPNTVEIFDYGHAADGTFFYVMEYLPGPNLEELVEQQGPLPPGRAVHLLRQICGSLSEAHAAGLIHRDLKPTNIIACQRGGRCDVAKLLDFGLARHLEPGNDSPKLTQEGAIMGTPAYMSPEQAGGAALDERSDIYSLGAVAYFLLTGQPPFVRATAVQTLAAHLAEPVTAPSSLRPGIAADLDAVVLKCLAKEPAKRFSSVEAVERAFADCACSTEWSWQQSADSWRGQVAGERRTDA